MNCIMLKTREHETKENKNSSNHRSLSTTPGGLCHQVCQTLVRCLGKVMGSRDWSCLFGSQPDDCKVQIAGHQHPRQVALSDSTARREGSKQGSPSHTRGIVSREIVFPYHICPIQSPLQLSLFSFFFIDTIFLIPSAPDTIFF